MPHRKCANCHYWGVDNVVEILPNDLILARCTNPFSIQRGNDRRGNDACLAFTRRQRLNLAHQSYETLRPVGKTQPQQEGLK